MVYLVEKQSIEGNSVVVSNKARDLDAASNKEKLKEIPMEALL